MKRNIFRFVPMALAAIAGCSVITMLLWNWLMPYIFGLATISFWQALGLLVLVRILFSGFGSHPLMGIGGMHKHRSPISEKWKKMTPEERKEFVKSRGFGRPPFGRDFFNQNDEQLKQPAWR